MHVRDRRLGTLLALGTAMLFGCASQPAGLQSRLVIGVVGEPTSLDPLLLSGAETATIGPLVFSGLLTLDSRGNLAPDLATNVPTPSNGGVSRDGLTITYRLRPNLQWQDGKPLTAADVEFTFAEIMNPKVNVPSRTGYDGVARVLAPDPVTVVVRLKRRNASILSYFFAPDGNYYVLPRHLLAGTNLNSASFNDAPIGSGPYRVTKWAHGDYLRFVRNESYFGGRPSIAQLTLRTVPNAQTQLDQMRTRELSAVFVPNVQLEPQYARIPGVAVKQYPISGAVLLTFNMQDRSTKLLAVREAIACGLDIPRIVNLAFNGLRTAANAGRGLYGRGYDPSIVASPAYDPNRAKQLLAVSGWKPVPLTLVYDEANPESSTVALLIQQQLRRIGIAIDVRGYSSQLYAAPAASGGPLFGGAFQLALLELLSPNDPDTSWFFGCDQLPPNGFNIARYCNAKVDAANASGLHTYDEKSRSADASIVQRQVANDIPLIPLWQQSQVAAIPASLRGIDPSPFSTFWNIASWRIR